MALSAADRDLYDILYIRGLTDGSDTNLDTGLTLLDTQKVLGDGLLPNGDRPQLVTAQGGISLPGTNGQLPLLSNAAALGSPVLTLADANEISGIRIDGSSDIAGSDGRGIVGTGIDSFNIHDTFISNVVTGIDITSNTTPVQPTGSEDNYGVIKNVSIASGTSGIKGINLIHTAGTLDLLVTGNTISGFQGEDANQNGVVDLLDEDTNGNGILDPGEDTDFDGFLDLSEDKNGNGTRLRPGDGNRLQWRNDQCQQSDQHDSSHRDHEQYVRQQRPRNASAGKQRWRLLCDRRQQHLNRCH